MSPLEWLAANDHDTAGVTGTDSKALTAIAACWELHAYTGSDDVVEAVAMLMKNHLQLKHWVFAVELVAKARDWSDREKMADKLTWYLSTSGTDKAVRLALTVDLVER